MMFAPTVGLYETSTQFPLDFASEGRRWSANLNFFRRELSFSYPFRAHNSGQLPNGLLEKKFVKELARCDGNWWSPLTRIIRGISEFFEKLILEYRKIHGFGVFWCGFWFGRGSLYGCGRFGRCRRDFLYYWLGLNTDRF